MKQKGGFTAPGTSWSFIAKVLGLIIGIFEEMIIAQEGLKKGASSGPTVLINPKGRIKLKESGQ